MLRCDNATVTEQTWRPTPLQRTGYIGVGLVSGALASGGLVAGVLSPDTLPWSFVVAVLVGAGAIGFWLAATRSAITASDDGVTVRGLLSTTQIPWIDVARCVPGYSGIAIVRRDGSVVNASAVQKSNYSRVAGRRARADEIAEELETRARSVAP